MVASQTRQVCRSLNASVGNLHVKISEVAWIARKVQVERSVCIDGCGCRKGVLVCSRYGSDWRGFRRVVPTPDSRKIAHSCQSLRDAHVQVARAGGCTRKGDAESPVRIDGRARERPCIRSVMVTAGTGSPAVYPDPMLERLLTPSTPVAAFMVTLLVSVGFPVMVTLRVPSELTEEVPERVPAFGEVKVTAGGVSVVLYPDPMELKLVGTRMTPLAMVAVRFPLPVGLPENETRESRLL